MQFTLLKNIFEIIDIKKMAEEHFELTIHYFKVCVCVCECRAQMSAYKNYN